MAKTWTKQHLEILRKEYPESPMSEICEKLGKTKSAVASKARCLGLKRKVMGDCKWTSANVAMLKELYQRTRNSDISKIIGISEKGIQGKAFKLGLRKDPDFMYECSKAGMFKKGDSPVNKGKKQAEFMSIEGIERTKATRFSEGHLPHNTREDGEVSIRIDKRGVKYKFIRTSLCMAAFTAL